MGCRASKSGVADTTDVGDDTPRSRAGGSAAAGTTVNRVDSEPDDGSLLGQDVIIRNLLFRPDLEGERGSVIMWDEYEAQYTVQLDRFRKCVFAKGRHLRVAL